MALCWADRQMQLHQWKQCYIQSTGNNKWEDYLQMSNFMAGLVDNCNGGSSNYLQDRLEKKKVSRILADLQSKPIPQCGFYFDICFQCFRQIEKTNPAQRFVTSCRDVINADQLPRYCCIFVKLKGIVLAETNDFRWGKEGADRICLILKFETKIVVKFKELLRNSLMTAVLKVGATHISGTEAENHPYDCKKSELYTTSLLGSRGFNLVSKYRHQSELLQVDFSLVLEIPSTDEITNNILVAMKNYVDTNTKMLPVADSIDQIPWHKPSRKKVNVLNGIRPILTFEHHVQSNNHLVWRTKFRS